jgi:hypothetical protein
VKPKRRGATAAFTDSHHTFKSERTLHNHKFVNEGNEDEGCAQCST